MAVVVLLAMSAGGGAPIAAFLEKLRGTAGSPLTVPDLVKMGSPESDISVAFGKEIGAILQELERGSEEEAIDHAEILAALRNYAPTVQRYSFAGYLENERKS
jgi:hypothetical protein